MKPYNVLQEEFPEKVHALVMDGFYDAAPGEHGSKFETLFYLEYETIMCDMQMKPLPLEYLKDQQRYQILSEFWESTTDLSMSSYYKIFKQRYQDMFVEKQIEPDFDEEESDLLLSVDYRTTNEYYAVAKLKEMMREPADYLEKMDGYGWIENRKTIFYEFMEELCERYKLPRLPIKFDTEDHKPCFAVSRSEENLFRTMLLTRQKIDEEYAVVAEGRKERLEKLGNEELSDEEKARRVKEIHHVCDYRNEKISDKAEARWLKENQQSHFPSRLDFYPIEIIQRMDENKDCTLRYYQTMDPRDDYLAYLPFRPSAPKNDFLSN